MRKNPRAANERAFSLELRRREQVRQASLSPQDSEEVLIEGSLGKLEKARFVDDILLEISGSKGKFRFDLSKQEMLRFLKEVNGE